MGLKTGGSAGLTGHQPSSCLRRLWWALIEQDTRLPPLDSACTGINRPCLQTTSVRNTGGKVQRHGSVQGDLREVVMCAEVSMSPAQPHTPYSCQFQTWSTFLPFRPSCLTAHTRLPGWSSMLTSYKKRPLVNNGYASCLHSIFIFSKALSHFIFSTTLPGSRGSPIPI